MTRKLWLMPLVVMLGWCCAHAEDIVQMDPLHTHAGVTTGDAATLHFRMATSQSDGVWAYQLDVLLPDGIQFDETLPNPFTLTVDHYPQASAEAGFEHHIDYAHLPTGWWRIIVTPDNATRLTSNDGIVFDARYVTDSSLADGIYPVKVKGSVISTTGSQGSEPMFSTSYLVVGNSPLSVEQMPALTDFTGYLPSFVVDSLNADLALNSRLTSIDIRNVDSLSHSLQMQNANALILAKPGTSHSTNTNVVAVDGNGAVCSLLQLHESKGPFYAPFSFQVQDGSLYRPMVYYKWNTLCVPYAMSTDQVAATFGASARLARFSGLSKDGNGDDVLCFTPIDITAEGIEANVPYLIKPASSLLQLSLHQAEVVATTAMEQEADDFVFIGSYDAGSLIPDGFYYISDNRFWLSQGLSTMIAFRGIFRDDRPSPSRMRSMSFGFDDEDDEVVTAIDGLRISDANRKPVYNLQGQRVSKPQRGIFVSEGRKMIYK